MVLASRWAGLAGFAVAISLMTAAAPVFADLIVVTPVPAPPDAPLGTLDPISSLRGQILQVENQLTTLNSGTCQTALTGGNFNSDNDEQIRAQRIQQTRDNLARLKKELSQAELHAAFDPHVPTLVDTVLANLSAHENLENKFRLELPTCIHVPQENQDRLDMLTALIPKLDEEIQPYVAKLQDVVNAVRAHFKKLRAAADPALLKNQNQLAPGCRNLRGRLGRAHGGRGASKEGL